MDKLSDLPVKNDTVKTPEEAAVMNQFFPGGQTGGHASPQGMPPQGPPPGARGPPPGAMIPGGQGPPPQAQPAQKSRLNWKLIGLSAVLFVALANPWIDAMFCKIPYCGTNAAALLGIKVLLFLMLIIVLCLFV